MFDIPLMLQGNWQSIGALTNFESAARARAHSWKIERRSRSRSLFLLWAPLALALISKMSAARSRAHFFCPSFTFSFDSYENEDQLTFSLTCYHISLNALKYHLGIPFCERSEQKIYKKSSIFWPPEPFSFYESCQNCERRSPSALTIFLSGARARARYSLLRAPFALALTFYERRSERRSPRAALSNTLEIGLRQKYELPIFTFATLW